jgi:hypothetical protein
MAAEFKREKRWSMVSKRGIPLPRIFSALLQSRQSIFVLGAFKSD